MNQCAFFAFVFAPVRSFAARIGICVSVLHLKRVIGGDFGVPRFALTVYDP